MRRLTSAALKAAIAGFVFGATFAFQASAAEISSSNILGFTQNGSHFVFEEFGTRDGSGAPYVNLFAIDIQQDRWIKGTPVRLAATEEESHAIELDARKKGISGPLEISAFFDAARNKLRKKAQLQAQSALSRLGKLWPANRLAYNPPQEFTGDARTVRFSPIGYVNRVNSKQSTEVWRLELQQTEYPPGKNCYDLYKQMVGFKLVLINESTGVQKILNDDRKVPNSRGCPQSYSIEEVAASTYSSNGVSLAILVRYSLPGFERPDGRLLAVTTRLNP